MWNGLAWSIELNSMDYYNYSNLNIFIKMYLFTDLRFNCFHYSAFVAVYSIA